MLFFPIPEVHATGFNYQNEDEKVTLSFPSTLQKGKSHSLLPAALFLGGLERFGKAGVGQQFLPWNSSLWMREFIHTRSLWSIWNCRFCLINGDIDGLINDKISLQPPEQ